jgi:hypothetical protein
MYTSPMNNERDQQSCENIKAIDEEDHEIKEESF